MGKPPIQIGKPPIQMGKPPIQKGKPPIQKGTSPIQKGKPPKGLGLVSMQGPPPPEGFFKLLKIILLSIMIIVCNLNLTGVPRIGCMKPDSETHLSYVELTLCLL
jgi:hypothetical protein